MHLVKARKFLQQKASRKTVQCLRRNGAVYILRQCSVRTKTVRCFKNHGAGINMPHLSICFQMEERLSKNIYLCSCKQRKERQKKITNA